MNSTVDTNADPDPTSQIPWPQRNKTGSQSYGASTEAAVLHNSGSSIDVYAPEYEGPSGDTEKLTMLNLFNLTVSMAGVQIAWAVELGCVVRLKSAHSFHIIEVMGHLSSCLWVFQRS